MSLDLAIRCAAFRAQADPPLWAPAPPSPTWIRLWATAGCRAGCGLGSLLGGFIAASSNWQLAIIGLVVGGLLGSILGFAVGALNGAVLTALSATLLRPTAPHLTTRSMTAAVVTTIVGGFAALFPWLRYGGWPTVEVLVVLPVAAGAVAAASLTHRLPPAGHGK
jgi:hypothetical protein